MANNKLVIGLDIGTTYTGVAFCEICVDSDKEQSILVVQDWPKASTQNGASEKVPTEIAYTTNGIRWGFDIPAQIPRHMWTKLQLEGPGVGTAVVIKRELSSTCNREDARKPAADIIADFLKKIKQQLIKNLEKTYGVELWKSFLIDLVVTFPAVWSDAAKEKTMVSVTKAGFNATELPNLKNVLTVTEPEAAALYTLKSMKGSRMIEQLAVGDGFILCDMGGGTVDLIAYRVTGINPIAIEEATVGTGEQCGGTFVDRGFLEWLEKKLGPKYFEMLSGGFCADQLPHTSLPAKLGKMVREFRPMKCGFDGTEGCVISLQPPLTEIEDEERGMSDGELMMTTHDITEMFQFALTRTRELIEDQIRRAGRSGDTNMKYIFTVGGFAASPFIYGQLSALALGYKMEVIIPTFPWSAVARGAVCKGLEGVIKATIQARKCRRHYGTAIRTMFDSSKHLEKDVFIDEYTGEHASKQMHWIMAKGQTMSDTAPVHGTDWLCVRFWPEENKNVTLSLRASESDEAPARSQDQQVFKVVQLHIDLNDVPERLVRKSRNELNNKLYHSVDFEIELSIHNHIEYSVSIDGKRYGSVTATYE